MTRALNTEEFYDILTEAALDASQAEDQDSADEILAAIDILNPFAVGFIATALLEYCS